MDFYLPQQINHVMDNIERYIIPENIRAIKYLWDLNILTVMTNDYDNDSSFISIGRLSEENQKIFDDLVNKRLMLIKSNSDVSNIGYVGYIQGGMGIQIPIVPGQIDTFDEFKKYIDLFEFQDVQSDGYISFSQFLVRYTKFWKIVHNPFYEYNYENDDLVHTSTDYLTEEQKEDCRNNTNLKLVRVGDYSQLDEPIQYYLDERGFSGMYDFEEKKLFLHKRLYEGHMKYKNIKNHQKTL